MLQDAINAGMFVCVHGGAALSNRWLYTDWPCVRFLKKQNQTWLNRETTQLSRFFMASSLFSNCTAPYRKQVTVHLSLHASISLGSGCSLKAWLLCDQTDTHSLVYCVSSAVVNPCRSDWFWRLAAANWQGGVCLCRFVLQCWKTTQWFSWWALRKASFWFSCLFIEVSN